MPHTVSTTTRDILRAIRFGRHTPPGLDVSSLVTAGLVLVRNGRLALTPAGYQASNVLPITPPSCAVTVEPGAVEYDFGDPVHGCDDSGAQAHVVEADAADRVSA